MTARATAPTGAPCWADLWTSEVEGARRFYAELLGWHAEAPSPEFHGYFMFTLEDRPVAGGMGPMPGAPASDEWRVYLASVDAEATLETAVRHGATVASPTMPVADLGVQAVLVDPAGAPVGVWQPKAFPGFTRLGEPGWPAYFELHTPDHAGSIAFYRAAFGWDVEELELGQGLAYALLKDPDSGEPLAGVLDAKGILPDGDPAAWYVYFEVDDPEATLARATVLGGTVLGGPDATPFGQLATLADTSGARFKVRAGR